MKNISEVVKTGLCIGCGICTYSDGIEKMVYSKKHGQGIPNLTKDIYNDALAFEICPGKGYNILKDSKNYYGTMSYNTELGFVDKAFAAHSNSKKVLKNASSGGIMAEFLIYILKNKIVDKVAVTKFLYTQDGPKTLTFLTKDINEILDSQGSKYCPVDISKVIQEIKNENCRIAYLGTPCQIAGIRQIQKYNYEINNKIVLTIANFCGGFKSFNQIKKISKRHHIDYSNISFLRYRGGGQPGGMQIKDKKGNCFEASYTKYGGFTGHSKHLRCHLCVDATGELADISFGDAWLEKYLSDSFPWSIILTRTAKTSTIINNMAADNVISIETLSKEQVCISQKQNLESKKTRQFSRYKLYKFLGYTIPEFDGGYHKRLMSMRTEIIVFSKHKFKKIIEILGLYPLFRILIRKPY